jgi:hypothetical protein
MGSIYMNKVLGVENPRVGLLNVGTEEHKGSDLQHEAYELLKKAPVNFIGNVEGRDVPKGACDVIVTDGFTGNIILKLTEGLAWNILKVVKKKFTEYFQPKHSYKKQEIIKWVNKNIYNAKFNSVAVMWIKAYILIEIDNNSRIVKKPKTEIYKDREKFGSYKKEITVDIDAPVSEDSDTALSDILSVEDTSKSELEISEAYDTFKSGLNLLLDGVKTRDRSIFLKKFGIGLPRPMLPKEIAEQEGLSIARISQIFQTVIEQMQLNSIKYDINQDILFDAVRKIM